MEYTLGVVIPVPQPHRDALRAWRQEFGGAATEPIAPHITLVSGSYLNTWEQAAAQVRQVASGTKPFTIELGAARTFRPASDVVYLPLLSGADHCWALHRRLLGDALRHESSFAYHPHLTIAQDVPAAQLDAAQAALSTTDMVFEADRVQLFDTRGGQWNLSEDIDLGS
ncbi:2'-5' RNA ligase family protein [Glutamicibacter sp. JL.03c]|uniref:2'-5' RNA ligase family protein n=1 Tax=Glutamicibacter sp. JL.03c TaxID=2984842 RepID=UPI0021F7A140|nr:2'-5' RNA ligase family protein [Glutamicibacter sp. JL.03c]UYQ78241.1 2'-5' RNA ligase family protein [Glutamicibacter sp. JL.03c]